MPIDISSPLYLALAAWLVVAAVALAITGRIIHRTVRRLRDAHRSSMGKRACQAWTERVARAS